jgi:hypothetical protein
MPCAIASPSEFDMGRMAPAFTGFMASNCQSQTRVAEIDRELHALVAEFGTGLFRTPVA